MRLDTADAEEQLQAVGLLCREALISVAQEIFDPLKHKPKDGLMPSDTDAKRMLEAFLEDELGGAINGGVRLDNLILNVNRRTKIDPLQHYRMGLYS